MEFNDAELFSHGALAVWLSARAAAAKERVDKADATLMRVDPESVAEEIIDAYGVEEVSLDWDALEATPPRETTIDLSDSLGRAQRRPATTLSVKVPLSGTHELLNYQASTRNSAPLPRAFITYDSLVFSITDVHMTPEKVNSRIASKRTQLTTMIDWTNSDVRAWSEEFKKGVRLLVANRAERLRKQDELTASLTIPLMQAPQDQQVPIPVSRRQITPKKTAAKTTPNYVIEDAVYEDVVATIASLGRAFERLPNTADRFDETELRDLILFVLNANYQSARGEVFNGNGKTDLLVPWEGGNAFIGECKVWDGQQKLSDAMDQLFGYTVWRDTKAALVVFIKKPGATNIIDKADQAIRSHQAFHSASMPVEPDIRRDYMMKSLNDPNRLIKTAFLPIVIWRNKSEA
jgi:hypothetical protein